MLILICMCARAHFLSTSETIAVRLQNQKNQDEKQRTIAIKMWMRVFVLVAIFGLALADVSFCVYWDLYTWR